MVALYQTHYLKRNNGFDQLAVFGWRFIKPDQHNNAHCGCRHYINDFMYVLFP